MVHACRLLGNTFLQCWWGCELAQTFQQAGWECLEEWLHGTLIYFLVWIWKRWHQPVCQRDINITDRRLGKEHTTYRQTQSKWRKRWQYCFNFIFSFFTYCLNFLLREVECFFCFYFCLFFVFFLTEERTFIIAIGSRNVYKSTLFTSTTKIWLQVSS